MRWLTRRDPRDGMIYLGIAFMLLGTVNAWIHREGLAAGYTVVGGLFMLVPMAMMVWRILDLQDRIEKYEKS
jgi:hypothetical protein